MVSNLTNLQDFTILARAIYQQLYGKSQPRRHQDQHITDIENWLVEGESDHDNPDVEALAKEYYHHYMDM